MIFMYDSLCNVMYIEIFHVQTNSLRQRWLRPEGTTQSKQIMDLQVNLALPEHVLIFPHS